MICSNLKVQQPKWMGRLFDYAAFHPPKVCSLDVSLQTMSGWTVVNEKFGVFLYRISQNRHAILP